MAIDQRTSLPDDPSDPDAPPASLVADAPEGEPTTRGQRVTVSPVAFAPFPQIHLPEPSGDIALLLDVSLDLTVELGRTRMKIKEVLSLGPGAVVELDKLAGEPLDIWVNGTFIARGEVVVVDEKFGVRVTEVLSSAKRVASAV